MLPRFDVVRKMLDFFNNETENGKLYISYPMVEALYDYKNGLCESNYNCFISIDVVKDYKKLSSDNNDNVNRTKDFNSWRSILNVFSLKIKCLFDLDELNFTIYRDKVSTLSIYELEEKMLENENKIFVLSAFPEFLFDYFKVDFWKSMNKIKKNKYNNCRKLK